MEYTAGILILAGAFAVILILIAGGFKIAADARIEQERQRCRREILIRSERLAAIKAREIVRHTEFSVRVVPVNESDIDWGNRR
jgi:hypothetical protein